MATQAQQALEGGRRAIQSGSAGARNAEGTQQAKRRAIRRSGIQTDRVADAPTQDSRWESGNPMGITGIDGGYGGYGPTSPDVDKAMRRANPAAMTREVIDTVSRPKTVRAEGSIWDDPNYAAMANEQGAEYAMRARNLDRQIGMAQRGTEIRNQAMRGQLDRDAMQLEDMQNQQMMGMYRGTGQPPEQPVTDSTGAYTGEGHQSAMVGRGPMTESEMQARKLGNERAVAEIKAISDSLSAIIGKDYMQDEDRESIRQLRERLQQLQSGASAGQGGTAGGGAPAGSDAEKTVESTTFNGQTYKVGDRLPSGQTITKIYADNTVEVE